MTKGFLTSTKLAVTSDCMVSVEFGEFENQLAVAVTFHDQSRYAYHGNQDVIKAFQRLAFQNQIAPSEYRLGAFYNQQIRTLTTTQL